MVVAFSRRAFTTIHGSNDVLIGPSRSTSGNVIAILDPLSGWNDDGRPYEMQWYASDEQIALSGVAPPGVPFPLIGHSASVAIGWGGSTETAGPRALEQAWAMITAHNLAEVQAALRMGQIPGSALVGTAQGEIFDSSGRTPEDGILLRQRTVPQSEAMVHQLLAAQNTWPFGRAVDVAFSTAYTRPKPGRRAWRKVAPELPFVQRLTGWSRRSDATSIEALAFYLFKMALGKPEASALEPPDSLSNNRIRAALRKAQDQVETELPYRADYGTMFRVARDGCFALEPGRRRNRSRGWNDHATRDHLRASRRGRDGYRRPERRRRSWNFRSSTHTPSRSWSRARATVSIPDTLTIKLASCLARERPSPPISGTARNSKNTSPRRKNLPETDILRIF